MTKDEEIRANLKRYGVDVSAVSDALAKVRWKAGTGDWYVQTEAGNWYWRRGDGREWRLCAYGPLDD